MFKEFLSDLKQINTLGTKEYLILLFLFLLSSLFDLIGLSLIGPYVQNFFFEEVTNASYLASFFDSSFLNTEEFFFISSMILIIVFLFKGFFGFYVVRQIIIFASIQQAKLITELSERLIFYKNKSQSNSQIISNFLYNIRIYIEMTLMALLRLCAEMIIMFAIITFLLINFFKVSLVLIFFLFASFLVYFFLIHKKIYMYGKLASSSSEKMIEDTNNILNGYKDIVIYSKEKFFFNNIKSNTFNQMISGAKANAFTQLPKYFFDAFFASSFIIFLYFGKNLFPKPQMLLYISVIGLATYRLLPSLFQISICISNLRFSRSHLFEIAKISRELKLKEQTDISNDDKNYVNVDDINSIHIKDLNFKFKEPEIINVFNNFNIELKKGDALFISGESGRGKSTLLNILSGFTEIDSGNVYINENIDIKNLKSFGKQYISYSSQNIFLTRGSIKDNITMFDREVDEEKLEKVIDISCCKEFLIKKNIDLDYLIEDFGKNFSGGEKQRIQLARSLYFNKQIMFFDESTSAMELELEQKFLQNLSSLSKNKIIVFVSHRKMNKNFFNKELKL